MPKSKMTMIIWSCHILKLSITCIFDKVGKLTVQKRQTKLCCVCLEEKKKLNYFFSFLFSPIPELLQSWVLLAIFLEDKPSLCSSPCPTQGSRVWRRSCQRFWRCLIQWEISIHSHETKFSPQICCCSNKWGVLSCGFPYSDIQTWHRWVYLWMIRNKSTEQSPRKK